MAWQRRGNRRYLYKSFRVGGRVRTLYLGGEGEHAAEWAALLDLLDRVEEMEEAVGHGAERSRREDADAALARLCGLGTLIGRAALLAAGYHRHARGQWRRRRGQKE